MARFTKTNKDRAFSDALVSCRSTGWKKSSDLKRRQRQRQIRTKKQKPEERVKQRQEVRK